MARWPSLGSRAWAPTASSGVGDKVANDPVWKTTLKMGKPANVKLVIKDMEHAIEAINSGVTDKYKMIICVASIAEAKQLVDGCPQITSINLGNTKSKDEQRPMPVRSPARSL